MRFLLFVEGKTEHKALGKFLKRWLDPHMTVPVRVEAVQFNGFGDYLTDVVKRAPRDLSKPGSDVIAVIGLLDIYQLEMGFPTEVSSTPGRCQWAKADIEAKVNHPKFRQFFAVHETEAWLLSDVNIFPAEMRSSLSTKTKKPESVNLHEPPAKLLDKLYRTKLRHGYRKAIMGADLFADLDPQVAYDKCPNLKAMLDEMLRLAREAGL